MSDRAAASRPQHRWGRLVVLVLVLAVVGCAGWLAWTAQQARSELQKTRADLRIVKQGLMNGDHDKAQQALRDATTNAVGAHADTDGPLWAAAAHLPWIGSAVDSARGLADVADRLVTGPTTTLVHSADEVNPSTIWDPGHGVDLAALQDAAPSLTRAAGQLEALRRSVRALPPSTAVGSIDQARQQLNQQLSDLTGTVTTTARMARLAPMLLDNEKYLLVFQNPDEARGTGGLIGAYGILAARHGKLHVVRLGSNTALHSFDAPVIDLGTQFAQRYNGFGATRIWEQANASPHFPYAARIWLAMWQRQTGQRLDGVIATDPVALGYLLQATGPAVLPSGQQVTGTNAVQATLHDAYRKYHTNRAQNAYFQRVARAVVHKLFDGHPDPQALIHQLGKAAGQHRLLVYSTDPHAEAQLAQTSLGGVLPDRPGPFAELVVDNIAGSKLDYYLDRSLSYDGRGACRNGIRHTRVTITLSNTAPSQGLPTYVVGLSRRLIPHAPRGSERLLVSVYLAEGASMDKVVLDGKQTLAGVSKERGHTVVGLTLDLAPGQTHRITIDVTEPASGRRPVVPVQPLVRPQRTHVHVPPC